ncbi:hypothetical protein [Paenibacillus mendelii]|uniref:Uncharacterized protein n=1 Tax=Paenibacillus mendelii TaxID=206163 RepID=A0ABV6JGF6_9BACL|nr:hypothetical protein [Paenibacillus mendelii]MCQ6557501.1 hypothetical protein [Paenibacillus mendelii]
MTKSGFHRHTSVLAALLSIMLLMGMLPAAASAVEGEMEIMDAEAGLDITNQSNLVGIHYSNWFNPVVKTGLPIYDTSQILTQSGMNKTAPVWGPLNAFHFWGKPALGYYRSDAVSVIQTHMTQLEEAGVDFIIVDNTNAGSGWPESYYNEIFRNPTQVLLDTVLQMKQSNIATPHIVFWTGSAASDSNPSFTGTDIYNRYYGGAYDDLFVYYNGKPLLLVTDQITSTLTNLFTVRKMWGLQSTLAPQEWSFLQGYPQLVSYSGSVPEQMPVITAKQSTYLSYFNTATPKRGGITFYEQWKRAFEVRPKIITLTWWNEWIMQRFEDGSGNTRFVDGYSDEYSRDIEPQDGGSGSAYFTYMKGYIDAYKNNRPIPQGLVHDMVKLGDFEIGNEAWSAGTNVSSASVKFSQQDTTVPAASSGYRMLEGAGTGVAANAWRSVYRQFEKPVDFSQHQIIRYAFNGWGGAPGAAGYETFIRLTSSTNQTLERTVSYTGGWQTVDLDMRSWPYRNQVTRIDIGFRATGSTTAWAGRFHVDNVTAIADSYTLGDFEFGTDSWAAGNGVSQILSSAGNSSAYTPNPSQGSKLLEIQMSAVNGDVQKWVQRTFATPLNLEKFSQLRWSASGWGGAPGATSYQLTIRLTASNSEQLTQTYTVGNWDQFNPYTLSIGSWAHRSRITKIEIGHRAIGGNQAWGGKYFIDHVRAVK